MRADRPRSGAGAGARHRERLRARVQRGRRARETPVRGSERATRLPSAAVGVSPAPGADRVTVQPVPRAGSTV